MLLYTDQLKWLLILLILSIISSSSSAEDAQRLPSPSPPPPLSGFQQLLATMPKAHNSDYLIPKRACQIAARYAAQFHYVYTSGQWRNYTERLEQRLLRCLSEKLKYLLNMDVTELEPARQHDSHNFIIVPEERLQSLQCLYKLTTLLNPLQRCKRCHKYIFLWRNASVEQLHKLFQLVWERHIFHAVAIVSHNQVYTFEPFSEEGFRVVPVMGRYFYDKLHNLHGFELRISMFEDQMRARATENPEVDGYTAVDGLVARTIVESLNATARYIFPADGQYFGSLVNGSYTGALKDITTGVTHVGFNSRFVLDEVQKDIEALYPYDRRVLYIVVPAAEMRPEYLIFVYAFSLGTWRLMLLNFGLVCLAYAALQRCALSILRHHRCFRPSWQFYEICEAFVKTQLGEPVETEMLISSLRLFLISWILFSYVLTSIYFAKLESGFVQPAYEDELNSLDELDKVTVPIYAVSSLVDAVMATLPATQRAVLQSKIVRLSQNFSSVPFALTLSHIKHCAFILRDESAKDFLASTYSVVHQRSTYHVVREHMRSIPRSYIAALGTPFLYKFQSKVNRFFETGLIEHWYEQGLRRRHNSSDALAFYEDLVEDADFENADQGQHVDVEHAQKVALSLHILQGAFYLWLIGILLSLIGFVLEHVHSWWIGRQRRRRKVSIFRKIRRHEGRVVFE